MGCFSVVGCVIVVCRCFVLQICALQGTAVSVCWVPIPVKTRQWLVCDIMCWDATHARHADAVTDSVRMMLPMATFLQLSDVDF